MKADSFASLLVRKGERAIRSAHLSLRDGDADSAVNRAYYAMFNVARAALLSAGVSEGDLPRTHRGVIEAFRIHAVQTGRIDGDLASSLSRTENLRLKADYTATEIAPDAAKQVVAYAEEFVRTVERVFGLEVPARHATADEGASQQLERGSQTEIEPDSGQVREPALERLPREETRRKAAENWRRTYYDNRANENEAQADSSPTQKHSGQESNQLAERDGGLDFDPER